MKTTLPLVFAAAVALGQLPVTEKPADVEIPKDAAARIKTIACNEFDSQEHELIGQYIKLRFNYRDTRITEQKDGTHASQVASYVDPGRRKTADSGFGYVSVVIPGHALPWFSKLTVNSASRGAFTVVGKVEKDPGFGSSRVTIIGRELKTDFKGTRAVW